MRWDEMKSIDVKSNSCPEYNVLFLKKVLNLKLVVT